LNIIVTLAFALPLRFVLRSLRWIVANVLSIGGSRQTVEVPDGDRTKNVRDYESKLTVVQLPTGINVTMTYYPDMGLS
jgi:hypothetical protein